MFLPRKSLRHEYNITNRCFYFSNLFKTPSVLAQCNLWVGHRFYVGLQQDMKSCVRLLWPEMTWACFSCDKNCVAVRYFCVAVRYFCFYSFQFDLVYRNSSYLLWNELSVTLEQKCGMDDQWNEKIPQTLDGPTYNCGQLLVTAAVQFCESGKTSLTDNKDNIKTQYFRSKENKDSIDCIKKA